MYPNAEIRSSPIDSSWLVVDVNPNTGSLLEVLAMCDTYPEAVAYLKSWKGDAQSGRDT